MRALRTTVGALAAVMLAAILVTVVVPVSPAAAHPSILSTTPAPDDTVEKPPDALTIEFTETVEEPVTFVVTGPTGESMVSGPAIIDGTSLSQPLVETGGEGTYSAAFRALSRDGHPISGQITFNVGRASRPPASDATTQPGDAPGSSTPAMAPPVVPGAEVSVAGGFWSTYGSNLFVSALLATIAIMLYVTSRHNPADTTAHTAAGAPPHHGDRDPGHTPPR